MAEYIKRWALNSSCQEIYEETVREHKDMTAEEVEKLLLRFEKAIKQAPAADVVEVVRCKDCIYYHRQIGYGFGQCSKCRLMPYPEDFCSYGERKDGDGNE